MTGDEYNPYNDIREMYRGLDRELNRLNQDEILERLESYYDEVH